METRNRKNIAGIRKKRAAQQQSIVSLSCLACIVFVICWGVHVAGTNSAGIKAEKLSGSDSAADAEAKTKKDNKSPAGDTSGAESIVDSYLDSAASQDGEDDLSDAVFIGDSRTVGLQNNCDKPKAAFLCSVGMHIDTVMTDKNITLSNGSEGTVLDALGEKQYGRIYINLGINELGWPYIDTFKDHYAQLVNSIRELQPDAVIYAESILPVTAERSLQGDSINNTNVEIFNQAVREVAEQTGAVYLNCAEAVADADGNLPAEASTDGIHLIGEYCDKWLEYIIDNT